MDKFFFREFLRKTINFQNSKRGGGGGRDGTTARFTSTWATLEWFSFGLSIALVPVIKRYCASFVQRRAVIHILWENTSFRSIVPFPLLVESAGADAAFQLFSSLSLFHVLRVNQHVIPTKTNEMMQSPENIYRWLQGLSFLATVTHIRTFMDLSLRSSLKHMFRC